MAYRRRDVLGALGVASASSLLWAFGCGAPRPGPRAAPARSGEVRTWLRDAVARLLARYPEAHALAVSRRRVAAAVDVLGAALALERSDGLVLSIRDRDGTWREQVTSDLTADGVAAAAAALGGLGAPARVEFGPPPPPPPPSPSLDESRLRRRADELIAVAPGQSSRIVYAAGLVEVDDALVWSVARGRDLEQRRVRLSETATRAAWSGSRPIARDAVRAWSGALGDRALTAADLAAAGDAALEPLTPGTLDDGDHPLVLAPSVVALLVDTAVRHHLTAPLSQLAARSTPPTPRAGDGAPRLAARQLSIVDDPTPAASYGGFAFDDLGEPAAPIALLDAGRVAAQLAHRQATPPAGASPRGRRPGHLGPLAASSSHLVVTPGEGTTAQLYTTGFVLEGGAAVSYDPRTDRLRLRCSRARELRAGDVTGRVFADVDLVGSLGGLLDAVDAIAGEPADVVLPALDDLRWRSLSTPALRTRGTLRASRSRA